MPRSSALSNCRGLAPREARELSVAPRYVSSYDAVPASQLRPGGAPMASRTGSSADSLHACAPRGLPLPQAAAYIGVPIAVFEQLVRRGQMPGPKDIHGHILWDRVALDDAFGNLPDASPDTELQVADAPGKGSKRTISPRDDPTRPFTPADLAQRWGCDRGSIYSMIASGRIGHFKLGAKLVRIPANEVYRCEADPASLPSAARATSHSHRERDAAETAFESVHRERNSRRHSRP